MNKPATAQTFPVQAGLTFFWMLIFLIAFATWVVLGIWQPEALAKIPEWAIQLIVLANGISGTQAVNATGLWMDRMSQFPIPGSQD